MLSSRTELLVVGALVVYLAFNIRFQVVKDLLSNPVGKALALAGIVYVHQKLSCSVALLLVIAYVRCSSSSWEGFTTPTATVAPVTTCPDGYALDSTMTPPTCQAVSSMSGSVPASVSAPPPDGRVSTAPMTTPTPTMPPVSLPPSIGGVQPSMGTSSTMAAV
jgi:hypothetical protein